MENTGIDSGEGDAQSKEAAEAAKKEKVARDAAQADFDRFIQKMDLDVEPEGMDDEDLQAFKSAERVMSRAIRNGRLAINEQGEPIYTPVMGVTKDPIIFHEPKGSTYSAMDQKKKGHDISKMFASMAEMTQTSAVTFEKMFARDLKVCQAIVTLFLA